MGAWAYKQAILVSQQHAIAKEKVIASNEVKQKELASATGKFNALLASLATDLKRLSAIPKGKERTVFKRDQLLPEYMVRIADYLAAGEIFDNQVLVQCMIWQFDVGNIAEFWDLAQECLAQHQKMPERFMSNTQTFIADCVLEYCKKQLATSEEFQPYFNNVFEVLQDWPVPDAVIEKYNLFYGDILKIKVDALIANKDYKNAIAILTNLLNKGFKVKGKLGEAFKLSAEDAFKNKQYVQALKAFENAETYGIKCKKMIDECEKIVNQT